MATTEDGSIIIQLDQEVEGDHQSSDDYCFIGIGEPVPIVSGNDSVFAPQSPPSQPLSVSERFGLIFVAHSTGFCVARTKDVIESAKEIKEKGSGSSIKELSVVEVPIGKVYILALSADSSTLAACIDGNIHFFSVTSLLNKEQSPSFSSSLNDSSCVKDMQWTKKIGHYYFVLSNHGKLYYGARQDPLKYVMDNVDAVDWSVKGNFVAVARKNILSILSSKFKQKFSMSLSFKSWIGDSDLNCTTKVDSIRWVRPDCIILGCFQLTADGKEENYLVQVITSKDGKITDASSKPTVLSFSDVFEGFIDDITPFGSGPYMPLSYVDKCELAITCNRKSTAQHIVLFGWSLDDKKEAAVIDILHDDTLCPKIPLQENSDDDNMVLGLCVDKISHNEKVEVKIGDEYKELSPFCLLMCLSFDGKLFMFQVASVSGLSGPSDNVSLLSDEEDETPMLVPSEDGKSKTYSGLVVKGVQGGSSLLSPQQGFMLGKSSNEHDVSDEEDETPTLVSSEDGKSETSSGLAEKGVQIGSSPLSPQQNFMLGKSSNDKFHPNKENYRAASPTRLLNFEPRLSKQFGNVEEMIKELDYLLECIEGAGGFVDACTVLYKSSMLELETGIGTLFDRCRLWKNVMDERLGEIQLILCNTTQVLARKIYMEGIIKQATDGKYWDLWNRKKLSSELELKQQHILEVSQDLTKHLIELERHLNVLELNKFGENDGGRMSQRAVPPRYGISRHVQSLHSLHSTMSSQLAAAQKLGECLSKQMAVLSIEPPPLKKDNVRRELFEAIGIPYSSASFSSPNENIAIDTPSNNNLLMLSCADAIKGQSRRNPSSAMRGCESETARRRRDSLDQNWTSFTPPKITVKRMLSHEDRQKASAERSPVNSSSAFSRQSSSMSSTIVTQYNARGSFNLTTNQSTSGVPVIEKSDSLSVNEAKSTQRSKIELQDTSSISKRWLTGQTLNLPKKSSEMSNSNDKDINLLEYTIGSVMHKPSSTESSFFDYGKGPSSSSSSSSSSTSLLSTSSPSSSPLIHYSVVPSSLPNPTTQTSSLAISLGGSSTSFKASTNGSQATLLSQSSISSSPILSSAPSFQAPEKPLPSAIPIPSVNLKTESPKKELQPPIRKLTSTTDEKTMIRSSYPKPEAAFTLKPLSSFSSIPTNEHSVNFQSGSKLSFNGMATSATAVPLATDVLSAAVLSTSGSASSGKNESSDVTVTQEDEMEEEAPETSQTTELTLGSLGSFGIGSAPNPTPAKPNPFGATFVNAAPAPAPAPAPVSSPFNMTIPTGELFRPASFSFQSPQPFQPSQLTNFSAFSSGFSTATSPQIPAGGGFGQPAQIGSGQQALGSVLGMFGQARQLGGVLPGTSASSASGFSGGLVNSPSTGGFASSGAGFAGVAPAGGGGFAAVASAGGGFAGAASGSGFPGSGGGFGAFTSQQGSGGFSAFGSSVGGTGRPPSPLFTQMRK